MRTKTVEIEKLGTVVLLEKETLKRLSVRVRPDGTIQVSFPPYISPKEALTFAVQNREWIKKQQTKFEKNIETYRIGDKIKIHDHEIEIVVGNRATMYAGKKGNVVKICIPPSQDMEEEKAQRYVRNVIAEMLRREAKQFLPDRVAYWAGELGLRYEKVAVKKLKSKWGSRSSMGNINFNIYLMRLPDHLIDYVILHELAHTREMNHGPRFWALLDTWTNGQAKKLDREVKKYGMMIFN